MDKPSLSSRLSFQMLHDWVDPFGGNVEGRRVGGFVAVGDLAWGLEGGLLPWVKGGAQQVPEL